MKTLFLLALSLAASPAFAVLKKVDSFDQYYFNYESKQPLTLKIKMKHLAKDDCNQLYLDGEIRRQEVPAGTITTAQDLVADLSVFTTRMGCPRLDQPREVVLESEPLVLQPIGGWVRGSILVPAGAEVTIE